MVKVNEAKAFPTNCAGSSLKRSVRLQPVESSREGDDPKRGNGVKVESWARGHVEAIDTKRRILTRRRRFCFIFALNQNHLAINR